MLGRVFSLLLISPQPLSHHFGAQGRSLYRSIKMKDNFRLCCYSRWAYCRCFVRRSISCWLWHLDSWNLFLEVWTIKASSWGRICDIQPIRGRWPYFSALQSNVPSIGRKMCRIFIGVFKTAMLLKLETKHILLLKNLPFWVAFQHSLLIWLEGKAFLLGFGSPWKTVVAEGSTSL